MYGLLLAIQTGVTTFGLVGIYEAVVGLISECSGAEQRRKLFSDANSALKILLGVTLIVAVLYIYFMQELKINALLILYVLISGVFMSYGLLQAQIMRLEEKHFASLGFSFVVPSVTLLISGIAFGITHTLSGFFFGSCLGLILSTFAISRIFFQKTKEYTHIENYLKKIFKRITPYIAIAFLGWMSGYGNNIVVSKLFSNVEVAQFTFAMSIGAIMQLVASALNQVWSPHFFNIVRTEDIGKVEIKNGKFFLLQGALLGVIAMLGIILLSSLLRFVGGNLVSYAGLQIEIFIIFAGYIILIPWWHCSNYFLAYDRGLDIMNVTLATGIAGILLWLALIRVFGSIGIYLGFFAQMLLRSFGIFIIARRFWPLRTSWAASSIGIALAAAGLFFSKV